ncbi:MAG: hypothetical protein AVDCRST_MAG08-1984, partial [uncultured Acetobacteraceae bacterium]
DTRAPRPRLAHRRSGAPLAHVLARRRPDGRARTRGGSKARSRRRRARPGRGARGDLARGRGAGAAGRGGAAGHPGPVRGARVPGGPRHDRGLAG